MVKKTKEQALKTRDHILTAAEKLFQQNGVSRVSLQNIAQKAGVTRGAVYWHFKNKADLFIAMMERFNWPVEHQATTPVVSSNTIMDKTHALNELRNHLLENIKILSTDKCLQRLFYIANYQLELSNEMELVRKRKIKGHENFYQRILATFLHASVQPQLRAGITPEMAAKTMQLAYTGLYREWLLDTKRFDLVETSGTIFNIILRGVGISYLSDKE